MEECLRLAKIQEAYAHASAEYAREREGDALGISVESMKALETMVTAEKDYVAAGYKPSPIWESEGQGLIGLFPASLGQRLMDGEVPIMYAADLWRQKQE